MKNPHIIVDPATKRCLCGMYDVSHLGENRAVGCRDILSSLASLLEHSNDGSAENYDILTVKRTLESVVEDRP